MHIYTFFCGPDMAHGPVFAFINHFASSLSLWSHTTVTHLCNEVHCSVGLLTAECLLSFKFRGNNLTEQT